MISNINTCNGILRISGTVIDDHAGCRSARGAWLLTADIDQPKGAFKLLSPISVAIGARFAASGQWINQAGKTIFDAEALSLNDQVPSHSTHPEDANPGGVASRLAKVNFKACGASTMLVHLMATGQIPGIAKGTAKRLLLAFGEDGLPDAIAKGPEHLAAAPGMGPTRANKIYEAWQQFSALGSVFIHLRGMGIGDALSRRLVEKYGDASVDIITKTPYRICGEIKGVGFLTADEIALRNGLDPQSPARLREALLHFLLQETRKGSTGTPVHQLLRLLTDALDMPEGICRNAIESASRETVTNWRKETFPLIEVIEGVVYHHRLIRAEREIAYHLGRIIRGKAVIRDVSESAIDDVVAGMGITLAPQQRSAVSMATQSKVSLLTGGPGTGKTTVLKTILRTLGARASVAVVAPTGRAAKRAEEATGFPASTIHRLIGVFGEDGESDSGIDVDFIVVDESSMIDVFLMAALLRALPDYAHVLIVGDSDQLPSVGPGTVLKSLLDASIFPTTRLTEVFRQAAKSLIIKNAHQINAGLPLLPSSTDGDFFALLQPEGESLDDVAKAIANTVVDLVCNRLPPRYQLEPKADIMVLSPMKKGHCGVESLNLQLQSRLNPDPDRYITYGEMRFGKGDKVLQTRNNYDLSIFNGDIGFIVDADPATNSLKVDFGTGIIPISASHLADLSLAYAITIHKSQGSESPVVVIPMSMQHAVMMQRNLFFTGVTRGKRLVVVVGQKKAIDLSIRNNRSVDRVSLLLSLLTQLGNSS